MHMQSTIAGQASMNASRMKKNLKHNSVTWQDKDFTINTTITTESPRSTLKVQFMPKLKIIFRTWTEEWENHHLTKDDPILKVWLKKNTTNFLAQHWQLQPYNSLHQSAFPIQKRCMVAAVWRRNDGTGAFEGSKKGCRGWLQRWKWRQRRTINTAIPNQSQNDSSCYLCIIQKHPSSKGETNQS